MYLQEKLKMILLTKDEFRHNSQVLIKKGSRDMSIEVHLIKK
jgi:hypothetical protein